MPTLHVLQELISSARDKSLSWCDDPTLLAKSYVTPSSVAGFKQACRVLNRLPFRRLYGSRRALRSELPVDYFSGYGILLLFSGMYSY